MPPVPPTAKAQRAPGWWRVSCLAVYAPSRFGIAGKASLSLLDVHAPE